MARIDHSILAKTIKGSEMSNNVEDWGKFFKKALKATDL